ncbi:MAG: hypothetical protein HZB23_07685 [Deltaproteobacteria bacterium]|nr:hypothetical protein [Deltaproteobacteria bacterium]
MNKTAILTELKNLAEKLGIGVVERVLLKSPVHVRSGLCVVRGKTRIILERKLAESEKIAIMAESLAKMNLDDVYVMPHIRDIISQHAKSPSSNESGHSRNSH